MAKRVLVSFLVLLAVIVVTIPVLAAGEIFKVRVGPVDVVEPIVPTLSPDSPPVPGVGTKLEPGDSFTIKESISNISAKRGYWVYPVNVSWTNGPELRLEITAKVAGKILQGPLYIPTATTTIVEITVRLREDSPVASGVIFEFGPPTRIEPEKG